METTQVVMRGTVRPDGTLALDGPLELPAGPVEVTVRAVPAPAEVGENWLQYLIRTRAEMEADGKQFMNDQEIQAYIEEMRGGDDRIDEFARLRGAGNGRHEEC